VNLKFSILAFSLFLAPTAFAIQSQPVPIAEDPSTAPQVELSATGIGTAGYARSGDHPAGEGVINFADSSLQIGAAQRLYSGATGSFGLGWLTTDQANKGTGANLGYFPSKTFLDVQSLEFEALVGRVDNPTAHLVDFPTLREDDLITLTNPLNPFSKGDSVEEHRYSNAASFTFNQGLKYYENIHVQHQINSASIGTDSGLNSAGVTFQYLGSPGMEALERMPSWGVGYEHIAMTSRAPGGLNQLYAGAVVNLNEGIVNRFDFRFQDIVSVGSDLKNFASATDSFQADSNAISTSFRYLNSPFGRPGYQVALTAGFKNYFQVNDGRSFGVALTGVRRLGQGFDLVGQYKGQWRESELARVQAAGIASEQVMELGFIFNFGSTLNQHLSPRRTLLNQEHLYIPN
jgi:hypothetical protein